MLKLCMDYLQGSIGEMEEGVRELKMWLKSGIKSCPKSNKREDPDPLRERMVDLRSGTTSSDK